MVLILMARIDVSGEREETKPLGGFLLGFFDGNTLVYFPHCRGEIVKTFTYSYLYLV